MVIFVGTGAPIAFTACTTCSEKLVTCMGWWPRSLFAATLLLKATSEHEERPASAHRLRVHRVHHVQGEARDVHGLLTAVRSATEPAAALRLELAVSLI